MNSYWQRRFASRKLEGLREAERFNATMAKRYKYIVETLRRDVDAWYKRYAGENNLSLADARKELRAGELDAFKMTLEEFIRLAKQDNLSNEIKKILDKASIRVRLMRSEELYIIMAMRAEQALQGLKDELEPLLAKVYEDTYYKDLYEVQSKTGYVPTVGLPDGAIDTVLSNPWASDGKIFSERIWENQQRLINTLRYELAQSLMLQEGGAPLVGRIQSRFHVSFNEARRLVETETAFVQERAFMDSMATMGLEEYEIIAVLDTRTSPICRKLDKKRFFIKDAKPGITMPPFHCYCRSTTVPYIPGISDDDSTRAARKEGDPDGKTVQVPAELSYEEWYNKYVKGSTKYKLQQVMKDKKINGKLIMEPKQLNLDNYTFDDEHINKERDHKVTKEEAVSFMKNAKFALSRWNGAYMNYYSREGSVYIHLESKTIRTAFRRSEFKDKAKAMMEMIENED